MSKPMTADEQVQQFKKFGLRVVEMPGWRTHNRNAVGAWGNVVGCVVHHTGSDTGAASMEAYLYRGDAGRALPGPLCQWSIRRDGTAVMVGNGRANHAGKGDRDVYQAVLSENYGSYPPRPNEDNFDGNAVYYGIETQYSGGSAPVKAQYDSMVRMCAAACAFHGWSAKSVIAHKEHTSRKSDPGHVDMAVFRRDVQTLLDQGKAPVPTAVKPVLSAYEKLRIIAHQRYRKIKNLQRQLKEERDS